MARTGLEAAASRPGLLEPDRWRLSALEAMARGEAPPEAKGGVVKDVEIGGVHIHHQVWGLLLMLVAGMLEFAFEFSSPWLEVLGILFGAGAALVLDEFALFLHLDDVYWSTAGQKSIDAVVATLCVMAALILGSGPLGITAQDLERVPEVGPQLVENTPRRKMVAVKPTLSAALAGMARLNERVRHLEGKGK